MRDFNNNESKKELKFAKVNSGYIQLNKGN